MEDLREMLHEAIDKYGLTSEKTREIDSYLQIEVVRKQRESINGINS